MLEHNTHPFELMLLAIAMTLDTLNMFHLASTCGIGFANICLYASIMAGKKRANKQKRTNENGPDKNRPTQNGTN